MLMPLSDRNRLLSASEIQRAETRTMATKPQQEKYLNHLREALAKMGLVLLESAWMGSRSFYRFRCAHGHEWARSGKSILAVPVECPTCKAATKLARLQEAAKLAGGECLSTAYVNSKTRYDFRCAEGHRFEALGEHINQGKWCPQCVWAQMSVARRDANGLERLREVARRRGGECLSET